MDQKQIHNKLPVAWEGIPFILVAAAVSIVSFFLRWESATIILTAATAGIIYFFRDPERISPEAENAILSPADGKVLSIERLDCGANPLHASATKISIFMSLFNSHINRIPCTGKITNISYYPGKFFSANKNKASLYNEHNVVSLETDSNQRIIFVQIAGFIARRIACWVKPGDHVGQGQRFGLIRFGSRLDVYLPAHCAIAVTKGQKVKAGQNIIGYFN